MRHPTSNSFLTEGLLNISFRGPGNSLVTWPVSGGHRDPIWVLVCWFPFWPLTGRLGSLLFFSSYCCFLRFSAVKCLNSSLGSPRGNGYFLLTHPKSDPRNEDFSPGHKKKWHRVGLHPWDWGGGGWNKQWVQWELALSVCTFLNSMQIAKQKSSQPSLGTFPFSHLCRLTTINIWVTTPDKVDSLLKTTF